MTDIDTRTHRTDLNRVVMDLDDDAWSRVVATTTTNESNSTTTTATVDHPTTHTPRMSGLGLAGMGFMTGS